ncbi:hypothetical protein LEP1GSC029_2200 [Leptospira interrogans str. 2002000626]|uniref:Uncharacterized protein n=1 Tax=Leptospira interrogans str. 2002000626 TaxID=996803 RepID=A0A829D597_LEPIR|nr:hypothetical protein LEP1GSC025_3779 [Leptospira interrogans str. 2002000621]EMY04145.1 hypothetical protein LEP1GSC029_2200 [Leptospira interrogans str. 2002000626]
MSTMPQDTVCGIRRIFKENREKYLKITKGKGIYPRKYG